MRQSTRAMSLQRVSLVMTSLLAVSCGADTELTPRPDLRARAYFVAAPAQALVHATQWPSPSQRYLAHSDSTGWAEERVTITDTQTGRVIPIVTIRESDPGSGRSHRIIWTADGTALLIDGAGSLRGAKPTSLCLVYRLAEADLLSAAPCTTADRAVAQ